MKYILIVFLCTAAFVAATEVKKCPKNKHGIKYDDLEDRVNLQNCTKPPCVAKKDTFLKVEFKFTPDHDVKGAVNKVTAEILTAKLPFPGVDGQSACSHIYEADKKTKVENCEMKAGKDYYYSDGFEVLRIYPRIQTVVQWALEGSDEKNLMCFVVPVSII
ncbi:NPC intracellular cholesterol transporter 2 homolog a isoform X2 [Diorhabda carinulata]|uniref:NPC intracellular cholesterol transporter 2 homolog a-like isoform X4 n=1 Tax=Diorhabda sublineata TaxID=1163346 RepID=UPI0024E0E3E1|nr:NPC intracellular cholesterol transporter 2 homolog a-like isoform X4 [Diorhabda sublineata]XP_057667540.1 NPC intracellular cholesterol transporter 2 homolog a isoform X2 [Diorhabda carinulata]